MKVKSKAKSKAQLGCELKELREQIEEFKGKLYCEFPVLLQSLRRLSEDLENAHNLFGKRDPQ